MDEFVPVGVDVPIALDGHTISEINEKEGAPVDATAAQGELRVCAPHRVLLIVSLLFFLSALVLFVARDIACTARAPVHCRNTTCVLVRKRDASDGFCTSGLTSAMVGLLLALAIPVGAVGLFIGGIEKRRRT